MRIGILALQGAFIEHRQMLGKLAVDSFEIRRRSSFDSRMDGLIIPGGESTTIGKLLNELDLLDPIRKAIEDGLPVLGTCAGLILLSKRIIGSEQPSFNVLDITVRRNAYGRQLASFNTTLDFKGIGEVPATFIRAPYVEEASGQVEVLATVEQKIVAVRQGRVLATAFHPELSTDTRIHEYFLAM